MKRIWKGLFTLLVLLTAVSAAAGPTWAAAAEEAPPAAAAADSALSGKSLGAAIVVGLAAAGGGIGMGMAIARSVEGVSRQGGREGKTRTMLKLGLLFLETVVIYALIVPILIIFVL